MPILDSKWPWLTALNLFLFNQDLLYALLIWNKLYGIPLFVNYACYNISIDVFLNVAFKKLAKLFRQAVNIMMTSSNGNIFRVTGPLCGEFTSPVNSTHKGQWRGVLIFSLICVWINGWVNNREAGDLIRHRGHYDVSVMILPSRPRYAVRFRSNDFLSITPTYWHVYET